MPPKAFTSHLGSREHKIQKERFDKDPVFREEFLQNVELKQQQQIMQQQQVGMMIQYDNSDGDENTNKLTNSYIALLLLGSN